MTTVTNVTPASASPSRAWTTPRQLQAALVAIWVALVLFFVVALGGVQANRSAVQTIGKDAVPSILAAHRLKVSLSDLDANVVDELLVPAGATTSSIKGYVTRRQEITDSLIHAAENITYGDLERKPIANLTNALSAFERLAIKARTLHQRGDERGTNATYRDALTQLHENLLPSADALAKANTDALMRRQIELQAHVALMKTLLLLTGAMLLGILIATQISLSQRTHRTLNPALIGATVISLILMTLTLHAFSAAQEQVRVARDDAFASLAALWEARALAYDANSDESRWLFDRERRPTLEKAFFDKSALLLKLPSGQSYEAVSAATAAGSLPTGSDGYFGKELSNITFAGERDAAQEMVRAFGNYYVKDGKIRQMESAGQHAEAVQFCVSLAPDTSNGAFIRFDQAMEKTIEINQTAFDQAIESGFRHLRGYDIGLLIASLFVGALALVGIRPRLREYEF